jgi:hypothetical protein
MTEKEKIEAARKSWIDCRKRTEDAKREVLFLEDVYSKLKDCLEETDDLECKTLYQKMMEEIQNLKVKKNEKVEMTTSIETEILNQWESLVEEHYKDHS